MPTRLAVAKTHKLFIGSAFPRSESGRTAAVRDAQGDTLAHVAYASRKDLRDAVAAARKAQPGWADRTAYNRGQILYRTAEMIDARAAELAAALTATGDTKAAAAKREVAAAADRLVAFAGWADKFQQILGCQNPVAGPYHNFAFPEPVGVVACLAPDTPALLGIVSLIAPPLCAGNTVVALASPANPLPAATLAEALATSDLPPGVVNLLTGDREELAPHAADHRDIDAVHAATVPHDTAEALRLGAADNLKRVTVRENLAARDFADAQRCTSPRWIEPFVEIKTIWHPSAT